MPQIVTIHNAGTVGASIYGVPEFGPWEDVTDVNGRQQSLIERRASGLVREAHTITVEELTLSTLRAGSIQYRQKLGPVTCDRGAVLVDVYFQMKAVGSDEAAIGKAVLRCQ